MEFHQPVLVNEVIKVLNVVPGGIYVDATAGNGGHSLEIINHGGIVYGLDQDPVNLAIAQQRISDLGLSQKFIPLHFNFNQLENLIGHQIPAKIDGILFDLGLSSGQQKSVGRGFSFNDPDSLDMRLDPETQTVTAEEIINTYDFQQLYDIFSKLAQEKFSKPLVIRIISERQYKPIKSAKRLADIIRKYYQEKHIHSKIDPATKVFMALRIAVNDEFANLKNALQATLKFSPGCVVAVISFHSGEDRLVKQFIRQHFPASNTKAILPSFSEIKNNPLSRSSVLRSYRID